MDDRSQSSGLDRLSGLPVGIIENILTRLPIKDAIETSKLSTNWRNRWVTIPCLSFNLIDEMPDSDCDSDSKDEDEDEDCVIHRYILRVIHFKTFVSHALSHHKGPLYTFRLNIDNPDNMPRAYMDQVLLLLSRTPVKELYLHQTVEYFDLSDCLYSLQNLTHLDLFHGLISPPPSTFKGFLCLRTLVLKYVEVPYGEIERIVANCPLLESLECFKILLQELSVRLSAPKLKDFQLGCDVVNIYICAPLLAKLFVSVHHKSVVSSGAELPMPKQSVCNYTEFFDGCTNLKSLTGNGYFIQYLGIGIEHYQSPLVFRHLNFISLSHVNFEVRDEILAVIHLVMDAVNLRDLHVDSSTSDSNNVDASKVAQIHFWDTECPQNCTFEKLRVVKMENFSGFLPEMKFIEFLLGSSPLLKEMIIKPPDYCTDDKRLDATLELLSYRRASTDAKVLFEKRQNYPWF